MVETALSTAQWEQERANATANVSDREAADIFRRILSFANAYRNDVGLRLELRQKDVGPLLTCEMKKLRKRLCSCLRELAEPYRGYIAKIIQSVLPVTPAPARPNEEAKIPASPPLPSNAFLFGRGLTMPEPPLQVQRIIFSAAGTLVMPAEPIRPTMKAVSDVVETFPKAEQITEPETAAEPIVVATPATQAPAPSNGSLPRVEKKKNAKIPPPVAQLAYPRPVQVHGSPAASQPRVTQFRRKEKDRTSQEPDIHAENGNTKRELILKYLGTLHPEGWFWKNAATFLGKFGFGVHRGKNHKAVTLDGKEVWIGTHRGDHFEIAWFCEIFGNLGMLDKLHTAALNWAIAHRNGKGNR